MKLSAAPVVVSKALSVAFENRVEGSGTVSAFALLALLVLWMGALPVDFVLDFSLTLGCSGSSAIKGRPAKASGAESAE